MSVKRTYLFWTSMLMLIVIAFGLVTIWHLASVANNARVAVAEYEALDYADAAMTNVVWWRDALRGPQGQDVRVAQYLTPIQTDVAQIVSRLEIAMATDEGDAGLEKKLSDEIQHRVQRVSDQVNATGARANASTTTALAGDVELIRQSLAEISRLAPAAARRHVVSASDRVVSRLLWSIFWLIVVLIVSTLIHYRQYRLLVRPLVWLRDDMKLSAGKDFKELVRVRGDGEFAEVGGYFNGLARELAALYRNLEEKVIARSRELVRSERLASVGFLAAGVAHEINNPLSVISGYAELAGKQIRRVVEDPDDNLDPQTEADALASALEAQQIVRDEAFRCKEITNRLLSLARGGGDGRQNLRLDDLARQVATLTRGLRNYHDRHVVVDFESNHPLSIIANSTEMKQVLMNLMVNALEATPAERGEVRVGGKADGQWVEVFVQDNGKGMSAEMVDRVFEPFFTNKRGAGDPGTGLGLSITHAIIENHGGSIHAESAGPGRGSRFTIRLPASSTQSKLAGLATV